MKPRTSQLTDPARRGLLRRFALGLSLAPLAAVTPGHSAEPVVLSESDPSAKKLGYVEDASRSKEADPGSTCANCSVFSGQSADGQGACSLFQGKLVKAAGWCRGWSGL
jgi:hypothetical protein